MRSARDFAQLGVADAHLACCLFLLLHLLLLCLHLRHGSSLFGSLVKRRQAFCRAKGLLRFMPLLALCGVRFPYVLAGAGMRLAIPFFRMPRGFAVFSWPPAGTRVGTSSSDIVNSYFVESFWDCGSRIYQALLSRQSPAPFFSATHL